MSSILMVPLLQYYFLLFPTVPGRILVLAKNAVEKVQKVASYRQGAAREGRGGGGA